MPATNFRITPQLRLCVGSEAEKIRDNMTAIRLLKLLESDSRRTTADEQRVLRATSAGADAQRIPDGLDSRDRPVSQMSWYKCI